MSIKVGNIKRKGYKYQVKLLTKVDNQNRSVEIYVDRAINIEVFKVLFEEITNCWVHAVHEVHEYKKIGSKDSSNGAMFDMVYKLDGREARLPRFFIPHLEKKYWDGVKLENELKTIFGKDLRMEFRNFSI